MTEVGEEEVDSTPAFVFRASSSVMETKPRACQEQQQDVPSQRRMPT